MLVDYGSDSDASGDEQEATSVSKPALQTTKAAAAPTASITSSLPKPRRRDGPLKITLEAPKRSAEDEETHDARPAKKAKLEGAGGSSLLAMLPPPKNKNAILSKKKEDDASKPLSQFPAFGFALRNDEEEQEDVDLSKPSSLSLIPPSRIAKGKEPAKPKEEAPMDFFSLGTTSSSSKLPAPPSTGQTPPISLTKSAAPSVKEFKPPPPTPNDQYPGYYQKPDGEWAEHDPEYYWSVASAWQPRPSVEEEVRRRAGPSERKRKQWEGDEEDFQQVSAIDEASKARAEIESSKSLTVDALRTGPTAPNMKMTAARSSNRAKSRHQLSTLLTDAYSHRAEIEDKIAMARRNRKESGNKYGF